MKLFGFDAISYAQLNNCPVNYDDPINDTRTDLTLDEAEEMAEDDPLSIWVNTALLAESPKGGKNFKSDRRRKKESMPHTVTVANSDRLTTADIAKGMDIPLGDCGDAWRLVTRGDPYDVVDHRPYCDGARTPVGLCTDAPILVLYPERGAVNWPVLLDFTSIAPREGYCAIGAEIHSICLTWGNWRRLQKCGTITLGRIGALLDREDETLTFFNCERWPLYHTMFEKMESEKMIDPELERQCSMTFWWPLVADVNVPKPETVLLPIKDPDTLYGIFDGDAVAGESFKELADPARDVANTLGYPLFLRTDHVSGKHSYDRTCFVPSEEELPKHIFNVLEEHALALDMFGPPFQAIALRRFIPLVSRFTAFWGLPIAKERRYFARDGQVECHHPYWPAEAIRFPRNVEPANWRDDLAELNIETVDEIALLTGYATNLAAVLPGYWSLDFALGQDGIWYFIDAARGERSWHPECLATKRRLSEISCV